MVVRALAGVAVLLAGGAAKVDITPADLKGFYAVWATRWDGIHDPIDLRARAG